MKKYLIFWINFIMLLTLCGCGSNQIDEDEAAKSLANQIFEDLKDKDKEGLKSLFNQNVAESYDLDKEIEVLFENFEGEIVSYNEFDSGVSREQVEYGKQMLLTIEPWIDNIETNSQKKYEIRFFAYIVNEEEPEKVGISGLKVITEDGTEYLVGKP